MTQQADSSSYDIPAELLQGPPGWGESGWPIPTILAIWLLAFGAFISAMQSTSSRIVMGAGTNARISEKEEPVLRLGQVRL